MNRDKFPEKIPFRLTRMLVKAMEVSGIEGNYRHTCEAVMKVLRQVRAALVSVSLPFIHCMPPCLRYISFVPIGWIGSNSTEIA